MQADLRMMSDELIDNHLVDVIDDELYEHYRITIDKNQEPLRIDKFLLNRLERTSRTKIQTAAEANCILVNSKPVKSSYKVKPGDDVALVLPKKPVEYDLTPANIPLDILYEDDDVIVVNKPAGLVVHPGVGNFTGTLVNALLYHFGQLPPRKDEPYRPGMVHRIDKNTSGLLVVTKNDFAMSFLAKQFFEHSVKRKYLTLVWGEPQEPHGTIVASIARHPRYRKLFTVVPEEEGKHAITHYKVIENFGYVSLIQCELETGRTHQIRVHMQHIGHPVFNDETYGGDKIVKGTVYTKYKQFVENCFQIISRQALHAKSLGFIHPSSKTEMYFESEIPQDFKFVLEKWRTYAINMK
jgi:23S rRNA pseudouridine1911/1915/1917 synthase